MLSRQPTKVATAVSSELGREHGSRLEAEDLAPFEPAQEEWCRAIIVELEAHDQPSLETIENNAPLAYAQLGSDAEDDRDGVAAYLDRCEGGLEGLLAELLRWCREQVREAEACPHVLALAEHVRAKRLLLAEELLSRYQTTLDNQLYKALKALREAQQWRSKTIDTVAGEGDSAALTSIERRPRMGSFRKNARHRGQAGDLNGQSAY